MCIPQEVLIRARLISRFEESVEDEMIDYSNGS